MEVIIHYKVNNDEVVDWLYKKADFPLNLPEPDYFAVIALQHLRKITKALTGSKKLFREFKEDLDEYAKNNHHSGLDELSIWVESNITNMSFAEVMRKRINKSN